MNDAQFFAASFVDKGRDGFALKFIDREIPRIMATRFANIVREKIEFGEINGNQLQMITDRAGIELDVDMDVFQAQSLFRHLVCQYNIDNKPRAKAAAREMARDYAAGIDIMEISRKMRLSPYIIFNHVVPLSIDVRRALSLGTIRASDVMSRRDADQYDIASQYDFESVAVQMRMAEQADMREANFVRILRSLGIQLKTQVELFDEARKAGTHPITPDVLFIDPVLINGKRAYWMDFKSYCGSDVYYIDSGVRAQSKKYTEAFGPGVIAYEHGYVSGRSYWACSVRALRPEIEKGVTEII